MSLGWNNTGNGAGDCTEPPPGRRTETSSAGDRVSEWYVCAARCTSGSFSGVIYHDLKAALFSIIELIYFIYMSSPICRIAPRMTAMAGFGPG